MWKITNDEAIDDLTLLGSWCIFPETYPNIYRTGARGWMESHIDHRPWGPCSPNSSPDRQLLLMSCPVSTDSAIYLFKFLKDSEAGIQAESYILKFPRILHQNEAASGELPVPRVGSFSPSQFYLTTPWASNTIPQQLCLSHPVDPGYTHLKWMNQRRTPEKTLEEGTRPFQ